MDTGLLRTLMTIDCILPFVVMVAFIIFHNKVIKTNNAQLFFKFAITVILIGVVLTLFSTYTAFGGFGPGAILFFGTFIMGLVTAFILFDRRSLIKERENANDDTRKFLIPLKLILVFTQFLPLLGSSAFYRTCDSLYRRQAKGLISAIENYYQNNDKYPDNLEVLIPEYISEIPKPLCLQPYYWIGQFDGTDIKDSYHILDCGKKRLLAVPTTSLGWIDRYDFATRSWSRADFLDGYCSYLE